ncbi:hypothetical protein BS329_32915 [Amycolatopsis coloradensis]|uniref:Helix-turn-helix domain-containing protein n=1 Tax=Amycolatopsis coloradensis TaxID=76021 RepID=A0A1R0KHM3_9PSEU|nr:helix-turn-helix domain-containing protein [Amycolatopsis coloradensis]OLZ45248.1 hypothetical protein BS329_32915 [Amycolatopsis coloradensis]
MDPLLTLDEVAQALKVSKNTIYQWRKTGRGPVGIRVGKYVRYRPEAVSAWLDEQAGI